MLKIHPDETISRVLSDLNFYHCYCVSRRRRFRNPWLCVWPVSAGFCLLNEDECFAISSARWSMKSCFLILRVCSIAPLKMQESCLFLFNFTYQSSICQHNILLLLASICFTHASSFLPPFLSIPASTCLPLLVINASCLSFSILVKRQLETTTDGWIYALSGRAKILKLCLPLC